jgi:hypothetical protein
MAYYRLGKRLSPALEIGSSLPDESTLVPRGLMYFPAGFPGENLLEPNGGVEGRTSAAIPMQYLLWCFRLIRASDEPDEVAGEADRDRGQGGNPHRVPLFTAARDCYPSKAVCRDLV